MGCGQMGYPVITLSIEPSFAALKGHTSRRVMLEDMIDLCGQADDRFVASGDFAVEGHI